MGARLRRLREEHGLTQVALARALNLSTSYVNQLENDQRPVTVPVLLTLTERFNLPAHFFTPDSDARLVADLRQSLGEAQVSAAQIEELAARMPEVGHAVISLHRRLTAATAELETLAVRASLDVPGDLAPPKPFEEVRDFFYDRQNYLDDLDRAAEQMFATHQLRIGGLDRQLAELLAAELGVTVVLDDVESLGPHAKRRYRPDTRTLHVARWLDSGQRAFQMATQLALLTQTELFTAIIAADEHLSTEARPVARIGLANYFAGALLLPYRQFLESATLLRYDIDRLTRKFEVGFETICHRLSTLQRPDSRGVPFIFVRADAAGNISKRQSATAFHFSRVGGSCPLWVVHRAFNRPGEFITQVAQMPDGRSYFWIARTTDSAPSHYLGQRKSFAIGLGCELTHAAKLIYSAGIDLANEEARVPIGAGCKVCDRPSCAQRAFPYIGRPVHVDPRTSSVLPYPSTETN
ncbi:short-chain fatty acyl-CoA regulator family protein [[Mycobacterium] wendilense]|uniref:Short-chain fatty acyl-CoA regulator family protein n=1 Tax=[Mycobacterium] wendilense TaxID=3064284 RepID=A0ABN9P4W5_9MYCO|nr:short-chain fatty acyl-CoA regulator family protein [Mycolicibacterium sp. MU0050]CAJ1587205.1 short-chain fatty acyl-CoA regulator family protein [Mycolicibacterium sp. MU0050]